MNQAVLETIELDQKINELKDQLNKQTGKNYDKSPARALLECLISFFDHGCNEITS